MLKLSQSASIQSTNTKTDKAAPLAAEEDAAGDLNITALTGEMKSADQPEQAMDIHLQPLEAIVEHTKTTHKTIKINVLDIDDTLLMQAQHSDASKIKCYEAWITLMTRARQNDLANNTITIWSIGTFRTMQGGIHEIIDGQQQLRPEITFLLQNFGKYINRNLFFATGGKQADGQPTCKVEYILNWLHTEHGIAKDDITIYDDQLEGVILPARLSGYQAIWIPQSEELTAANILGKPVNFATWSFRSSFWNSGRSQSMPNLAKTNEDDGLTLGF